MNEIKVEKPASRGRPRKFDEDAVFEKLTNLFWEKGYEATSMQDMLEATGLKKSSLYNLFGSKRDLYHQVLDRYIATRMEGFDLMAAQFERPGMGALHGFLDEVFVFGRAGCMAVNTTTELGDTDPAIPSRAKEYRDRIRACLTKVLNAVTTSENLDTAMVPARTEMLLGFMLGYAIAARTGASDQEMDGLTTAAHMTVDTWANA